VLLAAGAAARALGTSREAVLGALLLAADAAAAWAVYLLARQRRPEHAPWAALLFFANPVSVLASSFHLQFDNVSILFLLLAVEACRGEPPRRARAAAALAASLLVKHITAFFPLLFARGRRLSWAAAAFPYAVFAASFVPFLGQWPGIRDHVLRYQGLNEDFGVAMLWHVSWLPYWLPKALFYAASAAAILAFGRNEPALAALRLFLVMLIFIPGICQYYTVWPIALGSLFGGLGYFVYTLVVAATFFGSPDGLGMPLTHLPGWHGIWWSLLLWLAWDLRQRGILETR
jgi:hypothetical protein